ncbi:MAG: hypothetical protein ACR2RB_09830, partial [Gammaproteobacteria bacterium]
SSLRLDLSQADAQSDPTPEVPVSPVADNPVADARPAPSSLRLDITDTDVQLDPAAKATR